MKILFTALLLFTGIAITPVFSYAQNLLLTDFEGAISTGQEDLVNASAAGGSSVKVAPSKEIKYAGGQSLKVSYKAVPPVDSGIYIHAGLGWLSLIL
jgi:hypothetical protein